MHKIVVIDGQGGRMGALLVEKLKKALPQAEVVAVGTNSIATAAMMRAGADLGATGENPVVVNCRNASLIMGPLGIIAADALAGEVTAAMAVAVGQAAAPKVLLPVNRCNHYVVGVQPLTMAELAENAAAQAVQLLQGK